MKLRRMISTMLALLLAVSLLPMAAMATDNEDDNATISTPIDTNTGNNVTVAKDGSIQTNNGTITTVEMDGKVFTNNGNIVTNAGYVGAHPAGSSFDHAGNLGTIETNSGTISRNGNLVKHNQQGYIFTNDNNVTAVGGILLNTGTVISNDFVAGDNTDGEVDTIGYIVQNFGSIGTNNGIVEHNGSEQSPDPELGVIDENRCMVQYNYGTVTTNGLQALDQNGKPVVIDGEAQYGTIDENYGTVETNAIDGVVDNCSKEYEAPGDNGDVASSEKEPVVLEGKVENNFGTVNDVDGKTYYGLSWGDNVQSLTLIDGRMPGDADPVDLNDYAAKASRSGYRMTGFTAYSRVDGADKLIEKPSGHVMNAPVWLYIMWQELGGTGEPQPTRTPVYTNLSADQVRVGTFVRLGGCVFKIIEVNDDSIRVATVNKLPGEALTDMLGFLKQYLSDAQIAKLTGEPELLEQELVAKFFGGSNEHIAFYAARDLFA